MGIRTSVTCNRCSHQWRTKAQNPDEAKCPKCAESNRAKRSAEDARDYAAKLERREQKRLAKAEYARRTQQAKAAATPVDDKGKKNFAYNQTHAAEFVRLLCCWTFTDPPSAAYRRDKNDYRSALLNLIEVNKTRTDAVGIWETAAAHAEIAAMR